MRINHNISAQLANVSLKRSDTRLSLSLEKLSSGYKITKAADDSVGMAISNKMRTQIRSLDQSSRNADDGQSIIETADGALSEVHSMLQRIRELSVQAANDTYTLEDRNSIQLEINQLMEEIDRLAGTTEFNGKSLLDGTVSRTVSSSQDSVQALYASMTVPEGDYSFTVDSIGTAAKVSISDINYEIPDTGTSSIQINGADIEITSSDTDDTVMEKIITACNKMNITVDEEGLYTNSTGSNQIISIKCPDDEEATVYTGTDAQITLGDEFTTAKYSADGNYITITDSNGFEIQTELPNLDQHEDGVDYEEVTLSVYNAGYMTIQIGANESQTLDIDFPEISCETLGLRDAYGEAKINVCSNVGASNAISVLDNAILRVSEVRSELGAYQNRLASTVSSLDIASENMTESMSRIMDTDMASEMTTYTQLDVLKQAATSMLTQANNRPQQVMSLLQGM